MGQVYAIALNTFREVVRSRIFYSLILFTIVLLLLTLAASSASLNEEIRLMKDVGLFLASTFSVLISIFVGVSLVYKEIERKTIYTIAPKPIFRFQFLAGKYLGLIATMAIEVAVIAVVLATQFWLLEESMGIDMIQALWLVFVEVAVVTAVAIFFSSFTTPFLSGLLTLGIFAIGRFVDRLLALHLGHGRGETPSAVLDTINTVVHAVANVAPDLSIYNTTPYIVYEQSIEWAYVGECTIYGLTYVGITLMFAGIMLSRRDFV